MTPTVPTQLPWGAVSYGGGGGGGEGGVPAPPRNTPLRTALAPATRLTVMSTEPPEPTLTGKCIQAPALKSVVIATVLVVVPSLTITFWRRAVESQSTRVQVEGARVGRAEREPQPDLGRVGEGGGPALRAGRRLERPDVGGRPGPGRPDALLERDRGRRHDREVARRAVPGGEVVAVDPDRADPAALGQEARRDRVRLASSCAGGRRSLRSDHVRSVECGIAIPRDGERGGRVRTHRRAVDEELDTGDPARMGSRGRQGNQSRDVRAIGRRERQRRGSARRRVVRTLRCPKRIDQRLGDAIGVT